MEGFWSTLNTERVEDQSYVSHGAARHDILLYIEGFYNLRRRHWALVDLGPAEFEQRHSIALGAPKAIDA